jgi:hypothetical protein
MDKELITTFLFTNKYMCVNISRNWLHYNDNNIKTFFW